MRPFKVGDKARVIRNPRGIHIFDVQVGDIVTILGEFPLGYTPAWFIDHNGSPSNRPSFGQAYALPEDYLELVEDS